MGDFTCLGMQQQHFFSKDASEERVGVGGTASPQILLAIQLAQLLQGHNIRLPRAAVAAGSDKRWGGPKLLGPGGTFLLLQALRDRPRATAARGTSDIAHWMLRLRYCRNMLASWGKFSSLGCILV